MWKAEHDTVIDGEPLHAEGIGNTAAEIVAQMKEALKINSPGALSLVTRTIAACIKKGGDELIDGEDQLRVYELEDAPPEE